jgi:hypothetical protein
MKKSFILFGACALIIGLPFIGCNSPAQKVDNAQTSVNEANADLVQANKDYLADIEKFREATADSIAANNRSIVEFKARVAKEKKEARADYKKRISELEEENTDMKKRMDDFKADGKDKWEAFKSAFNSDMHKLGVRFRRFAEPVKD